MLCQTLFCVLPNILCANTDFTRSQRVGNKSEREEEARRKKEAGEDTDDGSEDDDGK